MMTGLMYVIDLAYAEARVLRSAAPDVRDRLAPYPTGSQRVWREDGHFAAPARIFLRFRFLFSIAYPTRLL